MRLQLRRAQSRARTDDDERKRLMREFPTYERALMTNGGA
jgi:hypothetical protein